MKTAIIYATNHGCTDKCAQNLATEIGFGIELFNIEIDSEPDLENFKTIIIGGSIHMGSINKKIKRFIDKNAVTLAKKTLGLFICCMYEGDKAIEQFNDAFPENLRNKALTHGFFGGEFNFDKMNFFEKAIVKKVANVEQSVSNINYTAIKEFAIKIKN